MLPGGLCLFGYELGHGKPTGLRPRGGRTTSGVTHAMSAAMSDAVRRASTV
jgi:hypothetical protein